jgi:hypothetical protein
MAVFILRRMLGTGTLFAANEPRFIGRLSKHGAGLFITWSDSRLSPHG